MVGRMRLALMGIRHIELRLIAALDDLPRIL